MRCVLKLAIYQIDAFTNQLFRGNPAAVCPLPYWLEDQLLQKIAAENNLSETAFYVKTKEHYELRWFTPTVEVNLCGHATLATAYVLLKELKEVNNEIKFKTKSGILTVTEENGLLVLDFPVQIAKPCLAPKKLLVALNIPPIEVLEAEDYLVVYKNEEDIINLQPNFSLLNEIPLRGVIATAKGNDVDFVSRWFGPKVGVNEDPVTGSAHTTLTPYWAKQLDKQKLQARQLSSRGGELFCELKNDRTLIAGHAVKYLQGEIYIQISI